MPKVVEPRSLREAVCRFGACLAALSAFERLCGPVTADAGISDGQAPAVTEGVPPCDLAEPVGDDNFPWSGAKRWTCALISLSTHSSAGIVLVAMSTQTGPTGTAELAPPELERGAVGWRAAWG